MLVLSRQPSEQIVVCDLNGDPLAVVQVVDVRGDKVRLGITAPKACVVHRMEVYQAIQREKSQKETGQS